MTKKELKELYYLQREIRSDEQRLMELESMATGTTSPANGMPRGGTLSDKTALAADIADLKVIIQSKHAMCIALYNKIMHFVACIDDSLMRQIIMHRHLDMMTWCDIAQKVGGGNSADGIRMMYERFIDKHA